jgi:hypothetical protein
MRVLLCGLLGLLPLCGGEVLYNGIRLPSPWPPRVSELSYEPMPVPYLKAPPEVISIDIGRQLFVDDFLVAQTDLKRVFHHAEYHPASPMVRPDRPWESTGADPTAMVFSDGVWYDPNDHLFKMWYMSGYSRNVAYAISRDGIRWEKPVLNVRPGTNLVWEGKRDSTTVWLDQEEKDPARRYKLFRSLAGADRHLALFVSPDGVHWSGPAAASPRTGDRTTAFYNPFRNVWVFSLRAGNRYGRIRQYWEHRDAVAGVQWKPSDPVLWVGADRLDPQRADLKTPVELYNLDAVAYESVLLGLFSMWRGQPKDRPKPNEIVAGYSRDGFHWYRPDRAALIPVSERKGAWNWGNVQSAGGCLLVVRDKLFFYVSGRAGTPGTSASGVSSTGLAILRRDGFASMDAGVSEGTLTTRPVRFSGRYLFVNAALNGGELRAEVLDTDGRVIVPFTRNDAVPLRRDSPLAQLRWKGFTDLSSLEGKPVRFRFYLRHGSLYSFWVSGDRSGASHGYVGAGGPGYTAPTDTVGIKAYK